MKISTSNSKNVIKLSQTRGFRQNNVKKPWVQLERDVDSLPGGFNLYAGEEEYKNNRSNVTLECKSKGHLLQRNISYFLYKNPHITCPYCVGSYVGEVLSVAVVHYLIGSKQPVNEVRQITPEFLASHETGGGPLKFDGFFKAQKNDLNIAIATEHQGEQHINPDHPFHTKSENPNSFKDSQKRDRLKRSAAKKNSVALIEIPDIRENSKGLPGAVDLIIGHFKNKINVENLQLFSERLERLRDFSFVLKLMEKCGFESTAVEKLRAQLIEEQSSVSIVTFDPVSRFFNLRCSLHPESWEARANNCIGSYSTGRKGTRCPECRHEKTGKIKRLKPNELIEKAEIQGFKPSFGPDVYRRNDQYLPWECLKCLNTIKDNWRHLSSGRGCKICNDESKRLENAKKEMGEIGKIVKKNKDTLISNYKSYKNQQTKIHLNCSRPGGCKQKFYMRAQKVKAGQLHRCDKYMRGAIATRRTKMQAF